MDETKVCIKCKNTKPLSEFQRDKYRKDGYRGTCKVCLNRQQRILRHNPFGVGYMNSIHSWYRSEARRKARRPKIMEQRIPVGEGYILYIGNTPWYEFRGMREALTIVQLKELLIDAQDLS